MFHLLWLGGLEVAAPSSAVTSRSAGQGALAAHHRGSGRGLDVGDGPLGHLSLQVCSQGSCPGAGSLGLSPCSKSPCQHLTSDIPGRGGSEQHQPSPRSPGAAPSLLR